MATDVADVLTGKGKQVLGFGIAALLIGNVVALSAYGSSETDTRPVAQPRGPLTLPAEVAPTTTTSAMPPTSGPKSSQQPSATTAVSVRPSAYAVPTPTTLPDGYDFPFTLEPRCVMVGEELTATVHLKRDGGVAMMAFYSDTAHHETRHANFSRNGEPVIYKWRAPNVPGDAALVVQAHDPESKRKGTKTLPFRVAPLGESC